MSRIKRPFIFSDCVCIFWVEELLFCDEHKEELGLSLVPASFPAGIRAELRCFRSPSKAQSYTEGWRLKGACGGHLAQCLPKQAQLQQVAQDHILMKWEHLLGSVP